MTYTARGLLVQEATAGGTWVDGQRRLMAPVKGWLALLDGCHITSTCSVPAGVPSGSTGQSSLILAQQVWTQQVC